MERLQQRHHLSFRAADSSADSSADAGLSVTVLVGACRRRPRPLSAAGTAADVAVACESPCTRAAAMRRNGFFLHDGRASLNVFQVCIASTAGMLKASPAVADDRDKSTDGVELEVCGACVRVCAGGHSDFVRLAAGGLLCSIRAHGACTLRTSNIGGLRVHTDSYQTSAAASRVLSPAQRLLVTHPAPPEKRPAPQGRESPAVSANCMASAHTASTRTMSQHPQQ